MYRTVAFTLFTVLLTTTLASPTPVVEERHIIEIEKRQADVNQLLQLASLAGITALPTDPAVLLSLGPLANSLASALPTPSVLSILLTAAPSGFVSEIVNDPTYASSFEQQFSAGSSPSWFTGLPTGVRGYLHTYSGFGQIAGAAGAVKGAATGEAVLSSAGKADATAGASASGMTSVTASGADAAQTSQAGEGAAQSQDGGGKATSATAGGVAPARPTGVIAAGVMGVVGVLGVVAVM
ncbi:MAG: hypothetical protein OHK93_001923 [Ramalina farinacea]|uniref:Uncharacterized protein n=1 Tax=Ramalina farinacea TaxID=258253 RepID=A0AA43QS55_9LECA|nr:hypothetical protein [Ramalina farinacea]